MSRTDIEVPEKRESRVDKSGGFVPDPTARVNGQVETGML